MEEVDLAEMFGGKLPPASIGRAAAAFGLNTSIGNAANTATGHDGEAASTTLEDIQDAVQKRIKSLSEGKWSAERAEFGPRTSYFF